MRAARLLRLLLILQNRGRRTSVQLAEDLEVTPRTILRDVDAMTEAGLPILVHRGNRGGIELGFDYRTRLTGLAEDEARALGLILSAETPMIAAFGLEQAAGLARAKLIESLPDRTRRQVAEIRSQFTQDADPAPPDARVAALGEAVCRRRIARLRFASATERLVHPAGLHLSGDTWRLRDALGGCWIAMPDWGRVNISGESYPPP